MVHTCGPVSKKKSLCAAVKEQTDDLEAALIRGGPAGTMSVPIHRGGGRVEGAPGR